MNCIEIPYNVTWSKRIDETGFPRRGVVDNNVENEELRENEERRDIFREKNIVIEHYASRKHLS